ncbi:glucose-1-phosphate cytidylyltransferase [Paenibacillus cymbidii]|uniref:glucose-1-phosphate cytidylyltransferase n=1 Tax=Paenibacillus cymbidii TaxID=1639034 RepID=UPI001081E937|nr:glucose-1-phosphate cytidylyltransferase [Paenibacillus cymbidii]
MKAVLLAGGLGTRISEETAVRPKPMIEIGGLPILWHIMKMYAHYGINDFIVCLGYKGYVVKEYFAHYMLHRADVTFDIAAGKMHVHRYAGEPWRITLADTGESTMTGGRLLRARPYIGGETFCMTYGDGLSDVPVDRLVAHHRAQGKLATLTAVAPPGRFGALQLEENNVSRFREKPQTDDGWINGGFFVLEPGVFELLENDETIWEKEPLERLAASGQLAAYRHRGFWQPMDTLRDKRKLEEWWASGSAPWKVW